MTTKPLGEQPRVAAGIHSIDHFALVVPDLDEANGFLNAFGLRVERLADELKIRTTPGEHVWARILPMTGSKKRLEYISVGCYAEDLGILRSQVEATGGRIQSPHPRGDSQGFWFTDIDGNQIQVKIGPKTMPDSKGGLADETVPTAVRGAPPRSQAPSIAPSRLAHLVLFTPDVSRVIDFYQRALGVLVADRSRNVIAFTYGPHGSDHHLLAFITSGGRGLHHSSWDVGSIGGIGIAAERLRSAGYGHQWGLGRHVLGSNYFNYIRDARGQWWEHICHIDYIPKGYAWQGGDYGEEDGFYLWGPDVPPDFGTNTEL